MNKHIDPKQDRIRFYELEVGTRFWLNGDEHIKVKWYENYYVAINLKTYAMRYVESSAYGVTLEDPDNEVS